MNHNHRSRKCSGQFQIAEVNQNTRREEDDPKVDEEHGGNGNIESTDEEMVSPASYVTTLLASAYKLIVGGTVEQKKVLRARYLLFGRNSWKARRTYFVMTDKTTITSSFSAVSKSFVPWLTLT
jgi:hypothetical protein